MRERVEGNEVLGERQFNEKHGMDTNVAAVEKWAREIIS